METNTAAETARVWITDGSLVPFTDSARLTATHRSAFGLKATYKGMIDPAVPVGEALLMGERPDDALLVEAEWCVAVPEGIETYVRDPDRFTADTPVVMQGLIEGKWINRLVDTHDWYPSTIGNNLVAAGPGIATTLGAIEAGTARGEIAVSYRARRAGHVEAGTQRSTLADLRGEGMLGLVRAVLAHCRETGEPVDLIDLSAMGEAAAIVNERRRIRRAMRFRRLPVINPLNLLHPYPVAQRVVRALIAEGFSVVPETPVTIGVTDGTGATVGEGTLRWRAVAASAATEAVALPA